MKLLFLVAQFLFLVACTQATPKIPGELVGIWVSDNAILRDGKWLMSGEALYLAADGSGAWVGGPPPIGVNISANFDSSKNVLSIDLLEREKVVRNQSALYDPNAKTLNVGSSQPVLLRRHSKIMDSTIQKGL